MLYTLVMIPLVIIVWSMVPVALLIGIASIAMIRQVQEEMVVTDEVGKGEGKGEVNVTKIIANEINKRGAKFDENK